MSCHGDIILFNRYAINSNKSVESMNVLVELPSRRFSVILCPIISVLLQIIKYQMSENKAYGYLYKLIDLKHLTT